MAGGSARTGRGPARRAPARRPAARVVCLWPAHRRPPWPRPSSARVRPRPHRAAGHERVDGRSSTGAGASHRVGADRLARRCRPARADRVLERAAAVATQSCERDDIGPRRRTALAGRAVRRWRHRDARRRAGGTPAAASRGAEAGRAGDRRARRLRARDRRGDLARPARRIATAHRRGRIGAEPGPHHSRRSRGSRHRGRGRAGRGCRGRGRAPARCHARARPHGGGDLRSRADRSGGGPAARRPRRLTVARGAAVAARGWGADRPCLRRRGVDVGLEIS